MSVHVDSVIPAETYWSHVADAASMKMYQSGGTNGDIPLISAETVLENASLLGIRSFVRDFPEKIFPLVYQLRPEFQELFIEYYVLGKDHMFLTRVHGQGQTHIWYNLRVIEQAIGALLILGPEPDVETIRRILLDHNLEDAAYTKTNADGVEETKNYGSLASMIALYAKSQSYARVAKSVGATAPIIRKIFGTAPPYSLKPHRKGVLEILLTSKDVKAAAVGSYLHSLTHRASLKGAGLSKKCITRMKRINKRFVAPPAEESPLINFGNIAALKNTPWYMFEIDSDHLTDKVIPMLHGADKDQKVANVFGTKPGQVFAPLSKTGELQYGYVFARSTSHRVLRSFGKIKGLADASATYTDEGLLKNVMTVPNDDIQKLICEQVLPEREVVKVGSFVQIKTGEASQYCGEVSEIKDNGELKIEIRFQSGRKFVISADPTAVKLLKVPAPNRAFWGERF